MYPMWVSVATQMRRVSASAGCGQAAMAPAPPERPARPEGGRSYGFWGPCARWRSRRGARGEPRGSGRGHVVEALAS
eukprot:2908258-Pyramimonas_sp.AAC.1